jgi:hypothetical protein
LLCRMLDRIGFCSDRCVINSRAGFRRKKRSQHCQCLRNKRNTNEYERCCTSNYENVIRKFSPCGSYPNAWITTVPLD